MENQGQISKTRGCGKITALTLHARVDSLLEETGSVYLLLYLLTETLAWTRGAGETCIFSIECDTTGNSSSNMTP